MTEEKEHEHEHTETDPPKTDPPKGTDPPKSSDDDSGTSGTDDLEDKIKKVVREVLGEGGTRTRVAPRREDIEKQAEEMVRKAQERLAEDEAHQKEHKELKEKLTKPVEEAPKKASKLTRLLWGEDK